MENAYHPDAGTGVEAEPTDAVGLARSLNEIGWDKYRAGNAVAAEAYWACSETLRAAILKGTVR